MTAPLAWLLTLDDPGDSQRFANHLRLNEMAQALRRLGFTIRLITPAARVTAARHSHQFDADERLHYPMPPAARWKPPGWDLFWFSRVAVPWLIRLGRSHRPHWVFTNAAVYAPVLHDCARWNSGQRPVVHVDVMGLASLERAGLRRGLREVMARRHLLRQERAMFAAARVVTTVNDCHAQFVRTRFALRFAPEVIRDGCDPAEVRQHSRVDLRSLGVRAGSTVVAFAGQLIHKRLDDLMTAMAGLPDDLQAQALIIGDGPDRTDYERRVAASDRLKGRVIFAGFQERRVALAMVASSTIAYSDCWSTAGFPFKLFEYMALGCPIVVEGKAQIREVLRDEEDAVFYRGAGHLGAAIAALSRDPERRHRLAASANATVEQHHTLDQRRRQLDALLGTHASAAGVIGRALT